MIRFLTIFLLLFLIGMALLNLVIPPTFWQPLSLHLASVSGGIIHLFDPDVLVIGTVLRLPNGGFALEVTEACNAMEFTLILICAMIAWPTPAWRYKLLGVLLAIFALQVMNVVRLVTLLYIGQWWPEQFTWIHEHFWPLFFSVDIILFYSSWIWFTSKGKQSKALNSTQCVTQ
jgi:exosortase H (IPTLxxWG-CTERM-specific)